jgi:hypothetical protein
VADVLLLFPSHTKGMNVLSVSHIQQPSIRQEIPMNRMDIQHQLNLERMAEMYQQASLERQLPKHSLRHSLARILSRLADLLEDEGPKTEKGLNA